MLPLPTIGLCLALVGRTNGDAYTYSVKSINLTSANSISFFEFIQNGVTALSALGTVTDMHAVHGIQTSDGKYVFCGKGLEADGSELQEAFAVKLTSAGAVEWAWKSGITSADDVANAVVEVSSTEVALVGYQTVSSVGRRFITKLDSSGNAVWTANSFGDSAGSHGAYEMIEIAGSSVFVSGLINKPTLDEMKFKSYGNTEGGQAIVQKLPLSALTSGTAPTSSDVDWNYTNTNYYSAKAARSVATNGTGNVAVLLHGTTSTSKAVVVVLASSDGSVVWGPTNYVAHGEGTDLQVSINGTMIAVSGQGPQGSGTYYARLTTFRASDGKSNTTKSYTAGGNAQLIYNECWGALATADGGFAMGCGTGIEGTTCDLGTLSSADKSSCRAGEGDPRTGACPRLPGIWQSLVIKTDSMGTLAWQRVDSYRASGAASLSSSVSTTTAGSSATEWLVGTSDGGMVVVTDEQDGFGILKLSSATPTPTSEPQTCASSAATPSPTLAPTTASSSGRGDLSSRNAAAFIGSVVGGAAGGLLLIGIF